MIKKMFARVISEILYIIGHLISFPMIWFDWGWLYPSYNRIMCYSVNVQDWADNKGPWGNYE